MIENQFFEYEVNISRISDYKFEVDFGEDSISNLVMDESEEVPGGEGAGPSASMLLASAVGCCLSASLTFCLSKKQVSLDDLETKVRFKRQRNEEGFWRIIEINVVLNPSAEDKENTNFLRCIEIFRKFCIVSGSVESGIPINVDVI